MTRQVQHRRPTGIGQPLPQLHRIPGVLHQQIQRRRANCSQDRGLLGLEIQLPLPARRRGHERQPQPVPVRGWRVHDLADAAHDREPLERVLGEELPARAGQQLDRRPQHRPRRRRRRPRPADLEHQRRPGPFQQPAQLSVLSVEAGELRGVGLASER
jgi:hypothetical protein